MFDLFYNLIQKYTCFLSIINSPYLVYLCQKLSDHFFFSLADKIRIILLKKFTVVNVQ